MLPVQSGSKTNIIGNNLPINNLNSHGFVNTWIYLGIREHYLTNLLQLVLVSILIVHNKI